MMEIHEFKDFIPGSRICGVEGCLKFDSDPVHDTEPWGVGVGDRGMGHHSYAVMRGKIVLVECGSDGRLAQAIVTNHNSHEALVRAVRFALTTPGMIKGRDALEAALLLAEPMVKEETSDERNEQSTT